MNERRAAGMIASGGRWNLGISDELLLLWDGIWSFAQSSACSTVYAWRHAFPLFLVVPPHYLLVSPCLPGYLQAFFFLNLVMFQKCWILSQISAIGRSGTAVDTLYFICNIKTEMIEHRFNSWRFSNDSDDSDDSEDNIIWNKYSH